MKRIITAPLSMFCVLLSACSSINSVQPFNQHQAALMFKQNHNYKPAEQMIAINIPNKSAWQRIDVSYQTVGTPFMYIPVNETRKNWTQSIRTEIRSYERYPGMSANRYFYETKAFQQEYCANVTGRIIQHNTDNDLFELQLANCSDKPDQQQYGKIFKGKDAIYVIYYTWLTNTTSSIAIKQAVSGAALVENDNSY